ncbi:TPA: fimbria/pilus outer membrane usher protein, partial [Escherichia coli]|nr:fimbria/pilus outer membrane usher protein [Escherichia coli]
MKNNTSFAVNSITYALLLSLAGAPAYAVDFNTDVLDAADRQNIDFSRFSQAGYIMPGQYQMEIMVNDQGISPSAFPVTFLEPPVSGQDGKKLLPQACLTPEMVSRMGLTVASQEKVTYWNNGQCADLSQLPGVEIRPNPAEGMLYINMPQAWLEYSDASWLPPSRWDNGIPGLLFDYNINGTVSKPHKGKQTQSVGYNGTAGVNFGAWRFRADYQGNLNHTTGSGQGTDSQFTWSRFYMYRAIPRWRANLTLGENYINSEIFSSWRYIG